MRAQERLCCSAMFLVGGLGLFERAIRGRFRQGSISLDRKSGGVR